MTWTPFFRLVLILLGYVYPAYACYKAVERNPGNIAQLKSWCHYWIILAALVSVERVVDPYLSWIPLFWEAKAAFIIFLWPANEGCEYIYLTYVQPLVSAHEPEVDRMLTESLALANQLVARYWQLGRTYCEERFQELVQWANLQQRRAEQISNSSMELAARDDTQEGEEIHTVNDDEDVDEYHVVATPAVEEPTRRSSGRFGFLRFRGR